MESNTSTSFNSLLESEHLCALVDFYYNILMSIKFNEVTWYSKLCALVLFLIVIPALVYYFIGEYRAIEEMYKSVNIPDAKSTSTSLPTGSESGLFDDVMNGTYEIEGQKATLTNGAYETDVKYDGGLTEYIETQMFGKPTIGDINGDGKPDAVFIIAQRTGGTGVFYYVGGALNVDSKYKALNTIIIGDRIAPQNINISNGLIIVNYATRRDDEPMIAEPSVGVTRYFTVKDEQLAEKKK